MRERPLPVALAEANGRAPPHIELSSVYPRRANMAKPVGEGHVTARSDAEVTNLVANRTFERREPFLRAFSGRIRSYMLQWIYYIKRQDVGRQVRD